MHGGCVERDFHCMQSRPFVGTPLLVTRARRCAEQRLLLCRSLGERTMRCWSGICTKACVYVCMYVSIYLSIYTIRSRSFITSDINIFGFSPFRLYAFRQLTFGITRDHPPSEPYYQETILLGGQETSQPTCLGTLCTGKGKDGCPFHSKNHTMLHNVEKASGSHGHVVRETAVADKYSKYY